MAVIKFDRLHLEASRWAHMKFIYQFRIPSLFDPIYLFIYSLVFVFHFFTIIYLFIYLLSIIFKYYLLFYYYYFLFILFYFIYILLFYLLFIIYF